jgi:hypothetical protein
VPLAINDMPGIGSLDIGNLVIALVCKKSENDNFQILNFFGDNDLCLIWKANGENTTISIYSKLDKKYFSTISNINYSKIVESIIKAPKSEMQDNFANQLVLEMLKAYDEKKEKNIELLKSAHDIVEYISKQPTIDLSILNLNRFQIIRRMRELSPNELHEISEIKISTDNEEILIGASILLESFLEAKLYYDKLSEERRKNFDICPITNLWIGK